MALIDCPECGRQVSDRASACPQCGYPIPQRPRTSEPPIQIKPWQKLFGYGVLVFMGLMILGLWLGIPPFRTGSRGTPDQQAATAATWTHRVAGSGVFYCRTKTGLRNAWAEIDLSQENHEPTDAWLVRQGCGRLTDGELVTIERRDGFMIQLNGNRWTSKLAVDPL